MAGIAFSVFSIELLGLWSKIRLSCYKKNIAYLNLIEIEFKVDGYITNGYGIGNVCTIEKGNGWGKVLMLKTNSILIERDKIGLLFCKHSLIDFYRSNNWSLIDKQNLDLLFNNESIETMIFNCNSEFHLVEFQGKLF